MQSLRTRKPSTAQRSKPPRQAGKLAKSSVNKDARKSRVDDRIKKRISMRYADISGPTNLKAPPVPSLPSDVKPKAAYDETVTDLPEVKEDPIIADRKLLESENFDPDAYLKIKLANSTEYELRSLQSSLRNSKDDTATDLQHNVFKNYAEFVLISKDISTLENEMLELKESLAEWKSMPSLLHIDDSASVAERWRNTRSSVADLRVLYANQMQTLHTQIEGSAKFAPTTAGRHVITEMDGILALNAATYKVDHLVRFVVLDDAVLVARRRKRRNNKETDKLVAEKCWPLNEMLVLDTKDTANMTNVFKIRQGKETHVYRAEQAQDKKILLAQFRHVAEELAAKKRKEREGEHERRKSLWAGGDRSSYLNDKVPPVPDWMSDLREQSGEGSSAKERAERDARWVGDFADDLTVAIALREWEKAVALVEEGKAKISTTPPLAAKLTPLTVTLINSLLQSLSSPHNRKSNVVQLISLLIRLSAGPAARSTFLAARSEAMRYYIRAIRFEGHIGIYINDLAMVMFTGIKHTADWFLASFKENEMASSFIEWAKNQIHVYAEIFRKQVYISDVDPNVVDEALRITHSQSKKLLQEYGLDFRFILDEFLAESPKDKSPPPFNLRAHQPRKQPESTITPASTPVRHRSPPPPLPARARTPVPASATFPTSPVASPTPRRTRSPAPLRSPPSTNSSTPRAATPSVDQTSRPPRALRSSPAPPPRSTNRPGSSHAHRLPPVAVPRRQGMI